MTGERPWISGGLELAADVIAEVDAHARAEYPSEACGFLSGPAAFPAVVDTCQRERNEADKYHVLDPERFDSRMTHAELATHLRRQRVGSVADLLRDFALSRTEAMRATRAGPMNTDTNLISEVRLARLGGSPGNVGEVEAFLTSVRGLDLLPYLPRDQAPEVLEDLAKALEARGRSGDAGVVRERIAQLAPQQPLEAR